VEAATAEDDEWVYGPAWDPKDKMMMAPMREESPVVPEIDNWWRLTKSRKRRSQSPQIGRSLILIPRYLPKFVEQTANVVNE
jgi:hypothetical protein